MSESTRNSGSHSPSSHVAFLDGVRAAAALWVVIGHARLFEIGWTALHGVLGIATNWASYMEFAVNVFIVLSGFCLTIPVTRQGNVLRGGVIAYFLKRAKRILPTYYAAVTLCLIINAIVPLTFWARIRPAYTTQEMPLSVLLTNFALLQDFFVDKNLISGPFWSIAVEWHIYFAFPLIVMVLHRFGRFPALLLSGAGSLLLTYINRNYHPVLAPGFLFLFGMGSYAASFSWGTTAEYQERFKHLWVIGFWIAAAALARVLWLHPILDGPTHDAQAPFLPLLDTLMGALTAIGLILLSTRRDSAAIRFFHRVFSWRPLVWIGSFSYSLYLIHITIQTLLYQLVLEGPLQGMKTSVKFFLLATVGTAIILLISYGFFLAFERPFMTQRKKESPAEVVRDTALSPGI